MTRSLMILAAGTVLLAGCGKVGPLERPAPMWGPEKARYESERRKAAAEANQPSAPRTNREQMDPTTARRAPGESQLPGVNDPVGQRPSVTGPQ